MERRPVTGAGILARLDILLGIAGILMWVGAIGTWYSAGVGVWTVTLGGGWAPWLGGFLILLGAAITWGLTKRIVPVPGIENLRPLVNAGAGALGGLIGIIAAIYSLSQPFGGGWGIYLTIVAGLFALFVSYRVYMAEKTPGAAGGL